MPREESSTKTLERLFLLKFTERPPNITAGNSRPLLLCMDMSRTTLAEAICAETHAPAPGDAPLSLYDPARAARLDPCGTLPENGVGEGAVLILL